MAAPNGNSNAHTNFGTGTAATNGGGGNVQPVGANGALSFPAHGGWGPRDWTNLFTQVRLNTGHNTVTLETSSRDGNTNPSGINLDRLQVQAATADGGSAIEYGRVFITADNGYILYINVSRQATCNLMYTRKDTPALD